MDDLEKVIFYYSLRKLHFRIKQNSYKGIRLRNKIYKYNEMETVLPQKRCCN